MPAEVETGDLGQSSFRIGEWRVEPSLNRVSRGDTTIQLELKVMDVLVCLAERAGEMVTRFEIIDRVWATEFIADNTLTHAVNEIRTALGDDARNPSFIETIHRRGYRLMVPVMLEDRPSGTVAQFPSRAGVVKDEDLSPYPGLAAFTEADAEFFFGRETEVVQLWRKLMSRRLLAVIGPSGVGKSSFLRAGVIPARPEGWGILLCQPGEAPFAALARALLPEFRDDPEALSKATEFEANAAHLFTRWRERHDQALLIVDQFEELFTLNTPDVQARCAALIGSLARGADVHVVLAMRDDFLYRCHAHEPLWSILEDLSALAQPDSEALRRALTEPARRLGFTFEDEKLAEEMVAEVEAERGALPMLAFAAARLWEKRDRKRRLITRQASTDIGGVGGALARHAEATLQGIGSDRLPIVREIFRNLVTAEGTRAVREWNELLSVFSVSQRESPEDVLRRLIAARLLTSFEEDSVECNGQRRVEIVHESLLSSWPRLVRWQTQDADAAQLRDQLRQAAKTWNEHGRTNDYLWSGKAFREFAVWHENYPGNLSDIEEEFAAAMTSHARRRKRRRRVAVAAAFAVLLAVLGIVGASRKQAIAEANRAEAAKLLALAQVQLDTSPTEALAYVTASLELTDSDQARRLALEALAAGPPGTLLQVGPPTDEGDYAHDVVFSPNGEWAALEGFDAFRVVSRDGRVSRMLEPLPKREAFAINASFDREGGRLFGSRFHGEFHVWSVPEFQLLDSRPLPEGGHFPDATRRGLYEVSDPEGAEERVVSAYMASGESKLVGRIEERFPYSFDREGNWFAFARGSDVFVRSLQEWDLPPRRIGSHNEPVRNVLFAGNRVAAELESGEIWIWPVEGGVDALGPFPARERGNFFFDDDGDWLGVYRSQTDFSVEVWDLRPRRRSPAPLKRFPASVSAASAVFNGAGFVPGGRWLATAHVAAVAFWPLSRDGPRVLAEDVVTGTGLGLRELGFTPNGRSLIALVMVGGFGEETQIWAWDLESGGPSRTLASLSFIQFPRLAVDPRGRFVAVSTWDAVALVPLAGGPMRRLEGFAPGTWIGDIAFDSDGRRVAACTWFGAADDKVIRIWNLETEEVTVLGPIEGAGDGFDGSTLGLGFLPDGSLVSSGDGGLRLWNVRENSHEVVVPGDGGPLAVFGDGWYVASIGAKDGATTFLRITDLETRTTKVLPSRIANPDFIATDPNGTVVVSAAYKNDGAVQVAPISGDEPYLLLGHERGVRHVEVSPDGRWIASAGQEGSLRLWPMPDLSKPPLHTLPHDELIAKLKTLTNVRVVRNAESPTGWKIEVGPFPGWETVPEW